MESSFGSKLSIDNAYADLVGTLKVCTKQSFPRKKYKSYLKPYWNQELTVLHKSMMNRRKSWVDAGKPKGGGVVGGGVIAMFIPCTRLLNVTSDACLGKPQNLS